MIDEVIAYIEANKETNAQRLADLLRIPSISTDPEHKVDMHRAAEWVHKVLTGCGIISEILDTPGHPCVLGDTGPVDGGGPIILVYGHYDVQPTGDKSLWDSPPFEPTIRDGVVFARGAADDKGQVLTHLLAAESWMKVAGRLPIRVKFLIEGEEEIGSANLEQVIRDHRERLACDYVVISDTSKLDEDTPAVTYGTKGMVYKEIIVTGPKQNLHSGSFGGTLANPGNVLAAIIASLRDENDRVTIPGFYDGVRELTREEKTRLERLPFDENAYLKGMGAPALCGEKGYSTLERRWVRPTLDVNGIFGGFTGEGASTVIPAKMSAKVSMRLVPDQNPHRITKLFDDAVQTACPDTVKLQIITHATCPPYVAPLESPGMAAATEAIEAGFGRQPVFIREGGSLPILPMFKEVLGADSLMMGFCVPGCNAHGPNEFFALADLHNGTRTAAYLLDRLAANR